MADVYDIVLIEVGEQGPAGLGVPTGGLSGQYLRKKSNANFDTEWADALTGNALAVVQENTPAGQEGLIWFNPTTKVEKIYANGAWQNTCLDGLYF